MACAPPGADTRPPEDAQNARLPAADLGVQAQTAETRYTFTRKPGPSPRGAAAERGEPLGLSRDDRAGRNRRRAGRVVGRDGAALGTRAHAARRGLLLPGQGLPRR